MADLLSHWAGSLAGLDPAPRPAAPPGGKAAPSRTLTDWLTDISRQQERMRAATPAYNRFDRTARWLTAARISTFTDVDQVTALAGLLRNARYPSTFIHGLDRVWSRAELGSLIVAAHNRSRQLAMGRQTPRVRGPRLDPARLPDDRLDHLIQRHKDLEVVEALRVEKRRRESRRSEALGM
jgi:hypothetical protein